MGVGQELNKVIVVGIPTNSTAEDLRLLCKPFGGIAEATVVSDAEGKGRGFGFVRFWSRSVSAAPGLGHVRFRFRVRLRCVRACMRACVRAKLRAGA